jgi:hypothetical protein
MRQTEENTTPHSRGTICPSSGSTLPSKTEGAGNAGCTPHPLPCVQNEKDARRPTQVRRNHSGTPCAMVLRLTPRSPRGTGLASPRREWINLHSLDPSVGGSGPHGLTVRIGIARLRYQMRPSHPAPRFVTTAKRLFGERGTARVKAQFPYFRKINIFAQRAGHRASFLKGRSGSGVLPVVSRRQQSALSTAGRENAKSNLPQCRRPACGA